MLESGTVDTMLFIESISTIASERFNLGFPEVSFSIFEKQSNWDERQEYNGYNCSMFIFLIFLALHLEVKVSSQR